MSFFVGLTHEVPCDFQRMAALSVFLGALQSPFYVPAVGRVTDTPAWTVLRRKILKLCVCVCVRPSTGTCPVFWHMPHPHWLSLSPSPQPSQPSRGESVPGVRRDLSAPEGGFFKHNKQHSGCWIGGNQASGCQTQWVKMFLAWLNFRVGGGEVRGRLHDCVKTSNKNLPFTKWATVSARSKGDFHARWNVYEL